MGNYKSFGDTKIVPGISKASKFFLVTYFSRISDIKQLVFKFSLCFLTLLISEVLTLVVSIIVVLLVSACTEENCIL